nr:NADH-ubiquinone oxidoreductase 75 kDa subunit-like [Nerophis lumbriciformis]
MVTIEIDGVETQVAKGSMIIEAADRQGISIPRFCYHNKLSIAANCRMCLVDVEKAPKPLPACATPVMDGMRVFTQSKRARSAQQNVMEFLLVNHPLDCPICDQGGECELQDVSMGFGRSVSRFSEQKRVVKDENLGPLISTDMTRCIHCTRCVRFLDELAGSNELGGMGRGEKTFISTFIERSIDSELAGNIIDLCPVGALTNKPFRFSARAWELRSKEAVATHDCVGSNMYLHVRRGEIMRTVPRDNEAINESWLSDRDRWGYMGLQAEDRALEPMVKRGGSWQGVAWDEALEATALALQNVAADDLGFLLSPKSSCEELYLAQKIARAIGTNNIDHRLRQRDFTDQASAPLRPQFELPIGQLDMADSVLLVGSNIRHDQPILGLKVRQAQLKGASVFAVNPVDYDFHFELTAKAIVSPAGMIAELARVAVALGADLPEGIEVAADDQAQATAASLKSAERAVIVFGDGAVNHAQASLLRELARAIAGASGASFNEVPQSANSAGAWTVGAVPHRRAGGELIEEPGLTASQMLAQPRKVCFLYDFEPSLDTALGSAALSALKQADHVIYCGTFASEEIKEHADVILPLSVMPEAEGSLINADGVTQVMAAAVRGPAETRSGWKVLRVLGNVLALDGFDYIRVEQVRDEIAAAVESAKVSRGELALAALPVVDGVELVIETPIYASDSVVRRSAALQQTAHGDNGARVGCCRQLADPDRQRGDQQPGWA